MDHLKGLAVAVLALGMTWAARAATDAVWGVSQPRLSSQATEQAGTAPAPSPAAASTQELSREEMEAELKRAQAELGTRPGAEELREFRPTKPLAADLAIALPSDI